MDSLTAYSGNWEVSQVEEQEPRQRMNDLEHFGVEVREARTARGLTQRQLGAGAGGYSESYVSKVESGIILCSETFARGCDLVFGMNGIFERLRERIMKRDHPSFFAPYARMEREAAAVHGYGVILVMGLLQTAAYAEAIFRTQNPEWSDEHVEAQVSARRRRREILAFKKPPKVWAVLHESCLKTCVGSEAIMADQLASVLADARSPYITIQVLPFTTTPVVADSFTLLTFPDRSVVAYADTPLSGQVTDGAHEVEQLDAIYDRLRAEALSPHESQAVIGTYLKGYTR
ncbi:helix-turn-helix transcriptional regulator [Streptomyces sp. 7-21]|uniref:helix-turn-helix domain-containing protein n=1 Tax=Streptomyces sp. 7-21 TaxID=2802283 RepID=UPI00191CF610|nr:helix-turn-helix transcriptional regulator [Streptomyces sp. 7-21]MBL1068255.1 helix-turn-helix domain-containing protein [Streptomyces sp. 7-21]